MKKKQLIIFVVLILLIYFNPINLFKLHSEIKITTEREKNGSNTKVNNSLYYTGFHVNPKEQVIIYPKGATVESASVLNYGLYLKISKEITFKKKVKGIPENIHFTAHASIWGLGNTVVKTNSFNKTLQEVIDKN
ncbi:hypothetical protein [Algibacter pacificus]|uniref:hypothetical protein n=1 Tax=Algibacter pacificus TaxID=2599389 RepID=UPI0011C8B64A|nr:hypothetical protein [Algibacter pacificus]